MGMRSPLRHARSGAGYLLPAILCVITAAACGSVASTNSAPKPSAPQAKVSLTVVVTPTPGASPKRWTLRCEPTGGTDPDPKAACRELLAAKNPFARSRAAIMCPMIVAAAEGHGQRHLPRPACRVGLLPGRMRGCALGEARRGLSAAAGGASGLPVH